MFTNCVIKVGESLGIKDSNFSITVDNLILLGEEGKVNITYSAFEPDIIGEYNKRECATSLTWDNGECRKSPNFIDTDSIRIRFAILINECDLHKASDILHILRLGENAFNNTNVDKDKTTEEYIAARNKVLASPIKVIPV